jgi:cytochrome c peroxidase
MKKTTQVISFFVIAIAVFISCSKKGDTPNTTTTQTFDAVLAAFGNNINPNALANYANQTKPAYLNPAKDNTGGNTIVDTKATLGRVLFYDKNLSIDNSVSCASCHKQEFAFSDTAKQSKGVVGGLTGRHSMRLINTRFAVENKFFWNERAATLEAQTTQPIQDHAEMGFSGTGGRANIAGLLTKLQGIAYYKELFQFVYNDQTITEARLQECMAQFIRSIQSFDAKYDIGRAQVNNANAPFPNYTAGENAGKNLFTTAPIFDATGNRTGGGLGCNGCHNAPEFDIDPQTRNNGIIGTIGSNVLDLLNTRSPSLRDLVNANGAPNGPMMHTGVFTTVQQVLGHYGNINIAPGNNNLDGRLRPGGNPQRLNLTAQEVINVVEFIKTLTGTNVYTDPKWKNPFL